MKRALNTLVAITVALVVASTAATAAENPHGEAGADTATSTAAAGAITIDTAPEKGSAANTVGRRAALRAFETTAPASAAAAAGLRLPGMLARSGQTATANRNDWQNALDAARSKRMRGIYLTLGGFIGGPLVGGSIGTAAVKAGQNTGGIAASTMIGIAGVGVGVWGVYQWITAQGDIGRLEREGDRAGYVSVTPVPGGAAATLALSF